MTVLYHGSGYLHKELSPGFKHSGKLVRWDVTESNEWLYASTDIEAVTELGFSSAFEKKWHLKEFHSKEKSLLLVLAPGVQVNFKEIYELDVYIYTIVLNAKDGWIKNNNEYNNLNTEWKTKNTVKSIKTIQKLDVRKWLEDYKIEIK